VERTPEPGQRQAHWINISLCLAWFAVAGTSTGPYESVQSRATPSYPELLVKTLTLTIPLATALDDWLLLHQSRIKTETTRSEYRVTLSEDLANELISEVQMRARAVASGAGSIFYAAITSLQDQMEAWANHSTVGSSVIDDGESAAMDEFLTDWPNLACPYAYTELILRDRLGRGAR
jgi:hypothetical protein